MASAEDPRADSSGDSLSPPPNTPPDFGDMRAGFEMFTTEFRRVVNIQSELVMKKDLGPALQPMFDQLDRKLADLAQKLDDYKTALKAELDQVNQKLDDHMTELNQKLDDHMTELNRKLDEQNANLPVAVSASGYNLQVGVMNVRVTSLDEALTPIHSLRTGDCVDGTAISINQLAALTPQDAGALLRAVGLPATGTAAVRRMRLAKAMGVAAIYGTR
ncbi:hypothetical protein MAPG_11100 [Magnaporthiopsis poae ATCC 64411]|uniref:Uncharacterized protein n=1 Tax=Magnaporthiopsis poae (strain ATCC 64411 / 73-15) TaxID=644358 RepID=A0A0C4EEC9_MAGP6|nr:hypothetical protein MAPG_11100 [Magnaporthiopsis poae ATCC 64411]